MKLLCSWSGGKDSCYALMLLTQQDYELKILLNMMNENEQVSRSHGLSLSILNQQSKALNAPLKGIPSTWADYEENYIKALRHLKTAFDIESVVFGDIDLESHREWEEKVCYAAQLKPLLPLWKQNRKQLVYDMIDHGIKAIIVSCDKELLGESFLGREITKDLVKELEDMGVDACGENGEYHTVVLDCPLFASPIQLPEFKKKSHQNYCFLTWNL